MLTNTDQLNTIFLINKLQILGLNNMEKNHLRLFIQKLRLCNVHFTAIKGLQLMPFGYCTWPYCDFDNSSFRSAFNFNGFIYK